MVIALGAWRRLLFFASLVCLLCAYLLLAGKEFVASIFANRPNLVSLKRAVRFSPGNAEYRHRLGRYYAFVASDPQSALQSFRSAVQLNPHEARYWFDMVAAYQVLGDSAGQGEALERALRAEPTAPDVAWEAANFFLVQGDLERALREFHVVIEGDPSLLGLALQACWHVRPDADALLRDVVPARPDSLLAFLSLLMTKQETDGTLKVWDRLVDLHQKFDTHFLFDYVRYLILARRPEAALQAWKRAAGVLDLSSYLPSSENLIVNGDFSLDILNGGFDWMYQNRTGVRLLLDRSELRQDQRSLSITFEGPGISDAGIRQFVPVQGGTVYDFTADYKSADFQGAGGPQIVFRDAYTGQAVFTSDLINDADFWKAVHAQFTTPDSTTLLILNIERNPAGSPIRGKLWLDNFHLSAAESQDPS